MINPAFPLHLHRNDMPVASFMAYAYKEDFGEILNQIDDFLHADELAYYQTLKADKRKFSYLTGRFAAKSAISAYLNEPDKKNVNIERGYFDQPIVIHLSSGTPEITISHCDELGLAIAYQPGHIMGVDVESIDFSKTHVFRSQLTDAEAANAEKKFDDYRIGYHLIWTAKEALSKAIKCGLTVPFSVLETDEITQNSTNSFNSTFKNFAQYKCLSWIIGQNLLSITLPKKTDTDLDLPRKIIRPDVSSS